MSKTPVWYTVIPRLHEYRKSSGAVSYRCSFAKSDAQVSAIRLFGCARSIRESHSAASCESRSAKTATACVIHIKNFIIIRRKIQSGQFEGIAD